MSQQGGRGDLGEEGVWTWRGSSNGRCKPNIASRSDAGGRGGEEAEAAERRRRGGAEGGGRRRGSKRVVLRMRRSRERARRQTVGF